MTPEQAEQLNDLHFALVGARRFGGDTVAHHDLATPILNANHFAQNVIPDAVADVRKNLPAAVDVDALAAAVVARLPQASSGVVAGPSVEQVKDAVKQALREGTGG